MKRAIAVLLGITAFLLAFVTFVVLGAAVVSHKRPSEIVARMIYGKHVVVRGIRFAVPSPCRVTDGVVADGAYLSCGILTRELESVGIFMIVPIPPEYKPLETWHLGEGSPPEADPYSKTGERTLTAAGSTIKCLEFTRPVSRVKESVSDSSPLEIDCLGINGIGASFRGEQGVAKYLFQMLESGKPVGGK